MKLLNQEIWLAYPKLVALSKIPLPVKSGLQIGLLLSKLQQPYIAIERERTKLVNRYGVEDANHILNVNFDNPKAGDFAVKFGELLMADWGEDIEFEKAKLFTLMSGDCPHCKGAIDIPFVIDPQILLPLQEKFIELVE